MALLEPESYSSDVLVVGDGNFSFSVCLATVLLKKSVKIVATSLDSRAAINNNVFAVENIETLSSFENVQILHEVDATDLGKTFGSRAFSRVIFNFPHTGGKSNIAKSRKLLEQFFVSAAKHVEPYKGDICVSLCQGQGGTPLDNPRRELGNTWQVVYQAAKADLILSAVHPFSSSDSPHYRSAGFRGRLGTGFHTVNGLTHVFVHGVPLETIPDIESFIANHNSTLRRLYPASQHLDCGRPIHVLTKKLEHFFSNIKDRNKIIGPFTICSQSESDQSKIGHAEDLHVYLEEGASEVGCYKENTCSALSLSSRVLSYLQENCLSFITSGIEVDFTLPPSSSSHPVCRKMVIARTLMESLTAIQVQAEVDHVLGVFVKEFCCNLEDLRTEGCGEVTPQANGCSDCIAVQSETTELEGGRQVKFHNLRNAASAGIKCECVEEACAVKQKCVYCRLEYHYLGNSISPPVHTISFIQPLTTTNVYHKETLLLSAGLLDSSAFNRKTSADACCGWLVEINLDNLAMALCKIPDVRLLSSTDQRFKEQFAATTEEGSDAQCLKEFVPFSIFPPTYIHDISFWITENMTEKQFFRDIYETTQGCVCDVWFMERYHDTEQDRVSYNYRMVYSSCDKPLSHLQTVQMQNLLRRKLLGCSFGLK